MGQRDVFRDGYDKAVYKPPGDPYFYPRRVWNADRAKFKDVMKQKATCVFFGFTKTQECHSLEECAPAIKKMQHWHMRNFLNMRIPDIRYNFLIGGDGRIYVGRGWSVQPSLPARWVTIQHKSLYFAFIGNFMDKDPPECMFKAQENLMKTGLYLNYIAPKILEITLR